MLEIFLLGALAELGATVVTYPLLVVRVALQFVHDMQERAHKNFEASRDRSLPVFGVGVVFIDDSAVLPIPSHGMEEAVEVIGSVVSSLAPLSKEMHFVPIETVYSSYSSDGKQRLIELMNEVSDPIGREDLLLCLRMLALQKVASEFGYNRIVLGSCISRIAAHVISATLKGQGYSLPADIQYLDHLSFSLFHGCTNAGMCKLQGATKSHEIVFSVLRDACIDGDHSIPRLWKCKRYLCKKCNLFL